MSVPSVAGVGALSVLQAHVAEYEFDGEIAQAVADVAELLAAQKECMRLDDLSIHSPERAGNEVRFINARHAAYERLDAAFGRCNGGAK